MIFIDEITLFFSAISGDSGTKYLDVDNSVTFSCVITGDPSASPSWTFGGSSYDDSANVDTPAWDSGSITSTITIDSASLSDDGDYVCSYESLSQTYTLDVYCK